MTDEGKREIAAFLRDYRKMCRRRLECTGCLMNGHDCDVNERSFDIDRAIAAVEAWRKRKKPCAEVIDKALDIYTLEVQIVRERPMLKVDQYVSMHDTVDNLVRLGYTINDFKAQRFALESHREE